MPRPCPYCGDPLSRERCHVPAWPPRHPREATPAWFYGCETCGREYHGYVRAGRLQLVPLTDWCDEPLLPELEAVYDR